MGYEGDEFDIVMTTVKVSVVDTRSSKADWAKFRVGLRGWFGEYCEMKRTAAGWEGSTDVSVTARQLVVYGSNFQLEVEWGEDLGQAPSFRFKLSKSSVEPKTGS